MSIKGTDPILGINRADPVKFISVFDGPDDTDRQYVNSVAKWAGISGVDGALVYVQFAQETTEPSVQPLSPGTSARWLNDRNSAGIGIPLDTTNQPVKINDGDEAARIHVQCLYSLVKRITHPGVPIPPAWLPWFKTVWLPKVCDVLAPTVTTLADLNIRYVDTTGESRATWAWDANYLAGMLAYAQKWLPDVRDAGKDQPVPDTGIVFGRVPYFNPQASFVTDAQSGAWNPLGPKAVDGVVWHRMEGTLWGTDGWFKRGRGVSDGLTEFGVGTANIDGLDNDGRVLQWNDPTGAAHPGVSPNRAPWASGPVSAPYGDGLAFLQDNAMDVDVVNRDEAAIEISGSYDDPVSPAAQNTVARATAWFADQKQIPWDQFPIIPGKDYSFVRWHQEICAGTGKECPGAVVINLTPSLIEQTRAVMKQYQTGAPTVETPQQPPKEPKYATPRKIVEESEKVIPYGKKLAVIAEYQPRQVASEHGKPTGAVVKPGATVVVKWLMVAADGSIWYCTAGGSRHPRWAFFKAPTNEAKKAD